MGSPSQHARGLLKKLKISALPIDPFQIAENMEIVVKEDDCEGYSGMLLVVNGQALISIKSTIREHTRKRFTAAHELGHYRIPEHLIGRTYFKCTDKDLDTYEKGSKEFEANEFAAELLMPEELFKKRISPKDFDRGLLEDLTSEFETSLTATARRFVEISGDYALVCSENFCIKWFLKGDEFPFFLKAKGERLSEDSVAIDFFHGEGLPSSFQPVPGDAWLDDYRLRERDDVEISELSVAQPYYNQVLTFLYFDGEYEEEDDAESYGELDGHLRFRK
jgi:Zn-dependent peptidase ImmA (M78 family)